MNRRRTDLYVVIWEPKQGNGGGHQLVADADRAEQIRSEIYKQKPDHVIRIEDAYSYAAAAVAQRGRRYRYG